VGAVTRVLRKRAATFFLALLPSLAATPRTASAAPPRAPLTLDDYRHFRALAIDLLGRAPTREEIAELERPSFDLDAWIDAHLDGPMYSERLTRIYMDVLRLEPSPAVRFAPDATTLYRVTLKGPDGKPVHVFYRQHQRRRRDATDGEFCLTHDETGLDVDPGRPPRGEGKPVAKAALDAHTVLVRPWWLYRDYHAPHPDKRIDGSDPEFRPAESLLQEADKSPTTEVRVCREEAEAAATGHVRVTGRTAPAKGAAPPPGRTRQLPLDPGYAKDHSGEAVSCSTRFAFETSVDCGCGPGLERCLPSDGVNQGNPFYLPTHKPLGLEAPLDAGRQGAGNYFPYWWAEEARHYFDHLWRADKDFREILTGRWSVINGPLAQFYRLVQPGNCCGPEVNFRMLEETEPLFFPKNVPADLEPTDARTWKLVPERGQHAAGILTMPIYLEKYASDRARGSNLYSAFLCKSFVAENAQLMPSTENDLTKRPGCSTCHATLEPLAAYFARIEQGNFVLLPASTFPVENPDCKRNAKGAIPGRCNVFYDPAFATGASGTLRGAYASHAHADGEAALAAKDIVATEDFATCAVSRVSSSFLGRPIGADDAELERSLVSVFKANGFKMRPLVRAIVRAGAYRKANNLSSDEWRKTAKDGGAP
jgi:hypothetical protein